MWQPEWNFGAKKLRNTCFVVVAKSLKDENWENHRHVDLMLNCSASMKIMNKICWSEPLLLLWSMKQSPVYLEPLSRDQPNIKSTKIQGEDARFTIPYHRWAYFKIVTTTNKQFSYSALDTLSSWYCEFHNELIIMQYNIDSCAR